MCERQVFMEVTQISLPLPRRILINVADIVAVTEDHDCCRIVMRGSGEDDWDNGCIEVSRESFDRLRRRLCGRVL